MSERLQYKIIVYNLFELCIIFTLFNCKYVQMLFSDYLLCNYADYIFSNYDQNRS